MLNKRIRIKLIMATVTEMIKPELSFMSPASKESMAVTMTMLYKMIPTTAFTGSHIKTKTMLQLNSFLGKTIFQNETFGSKESVKILYSSSSTLNFSIPAKLSCLGCSSSGSYPKTSHL